MRVTWGLCSQWKVFADGLLFVMVFLVSIAIAYVYILWRCVGAQPAWWNHLMCCGFMVHSFWLHYKACALVYVAIYK
jgi:hypothetical protein